MFRALALITSRQWQQHKLRLALTMLGIVLGVAVFFAVQTANITLVSSFQVTIEKLAGSATLQVTAGEAGFPQETLKTIRAIPGVVIAEPVIEVVARTSLPDQPNLLIMGLDTASDQKLHEDMFDEATLEISNPLAFLTKTDSIALSRAFAEQYGLKHNDLLPVFTQKGRQDFTVRGFFKPTGAGAVFGGNVAIVDVFAAQTAFGRGATFDRVDIKTDPNSSLDSIQQNLRERLPPGLHVERPSRRGEGIENATASMNLGLTIVSFLALTIGVFIIFNSFGISVNQRWKEIGILRSLGVGRSQVQQMFLGEAVVMGLLGSVIGIVVGFYLAKAATKVMSSIAAAIYGYVSTPQPPQFRWDYAATALGVGIFSSLLAAWLPARAASRLNPVLALHNIETQQRETGSGRVRFMIGLMLVISGVALTRFSTPRVGLMIQCLYAVAIQLGLILLLPAMIAISARVLRPVMGRLFGIEGVIGVDTMARAPRRTAATVGALMIGLSFVFANGAFIQSQKRALNRSLDRAVNTDLLVTTSEQVRSRTYHFTEEIAGRVAAVPGVKRAENLRVTAIPYGGDEVALLAHDMDAWLTRAPDVLDEGDTSTARSLTARGEGFVISRNFSTRWGVGLGDSLRLETPVGTLVRPVLGVLEYYHSEKGTIFMDREVYKEFWRDNMLDYILLTLNENVEPEAIKSQVQAAIAGEQQAFIYTHQEYKEWVTRLIDQFFTLTYLQMIVAILVAALGLINTLVISVSERRREIGVIRAIGGLRKQVRKMVLLEAVAMTMVGIAAGILSGVLNAYFLVRTAATIIAGFTLPLEFPFAMVFVAMPAVLMVALLAAWWPARRAVRLRVVEAIGYE